MEIMNNEYIEKLEFNNRKLFPQELKDLLIEKLSGEDSYLLSEQDIYEQSRHIIYNFFNPDVPEFINNSTGGLYGDFDPFKANF